MSSQDTFTPSTPPPRPSQGEAGGQAGEPAGEQPIVRDKRRLDPVTGQVRQPSEAPAPDVTAQDAGADEPASAAEPGRESADGDGVALAAALALAEERLADMQRLQAEYVNYRRRVERDRDVARDAGKLSVLESLLPVLDDLHLARQHGDLDGGPFAAIADKLEAALQRAGLERYGEADEEFDPSVHEALLHESAAEVSVTLVKTVLQPGYRAGSRVLRPARVAVVSPA